MDEQESSLKGKEDQLKNIQDRFERINRKQLLTVSLTAVVLLGLAFVATSDKSLTPADDNVTQADNKGQLTQYQKAYVDCPEKYLPLCTKMSKIPTEEVEFQKAEEGRLYLTLTRSDRTLIARIKDDGKDGYLIRIKE